MSRVGGQVGTHCPHIVTPTLLTSQILRQRNTRQIHSLRGSSTAARPICPIDKFAIHPRPTFPPDYAHQPETGFYRHVKSGEVYFVRAVVKHTENNTILVIYYAINPSYKSRKRNPEGFEFARPIHMFGSYKTLKDRRERRFQRLWFWKSSPSTSFRRIIRKLITRK